MLDARRIALMKAGAWFINMGRAATVEYNTLGDALRTGALAGAVLDVFDPEPLPATSPLWDVPNLVMTPHMSSDDVDACVPKTLDLVFENLRRFIAGRPLKNGVDPELGY